MAKPGNAVGFLVAAERCATCIFGKNSPVSAERLRNIIEECERRDTQQECHAHTLRYHQNKRVKGMRENTRVVCRGFYDRDPSASSVMQIGARLGLLVFVDENGDAVSPQFPEGMTVRQETHRAMVLRRTRGEDDATGS